MATEANPTTLRTSKKFAVSAPALIPAQSLYVMDVFARNAVPCSIYVDIVWPTEKGLYRDSTNIDEIIAIEQGFTTSIQVHANKRP